MRHVSTADLHANAVELDAAMDAGDQIAAKLHRREYRLVALTTELDLSGRLGGDRAATRVVGDIAADARRATRAGCRGHARRGARMDQRRAALTR